MFTNCSRNIAEKIVIDSKSGVSGAGVTPTDATHIIPTAVIVFHHTQLQHIVMVLKYRKNYAKFGNTKVSFTPHLVPVIRGIMTTVHSFIR